VSVTKEVRAYREAHFEQESAEGLPPVSPEARQSPSVEGPSLATGLMTARPGGSPGSPTAGALAKRGLSLDEADTWNTRELRRAVDTVHPGMARVLDWENLEKLGVDGGMLAGLAEKELPELYQKLKIADEEVQRWCSLQILRLQSRATIVGRKQRLGPLPEGWRMVPSRSRPGEYSYRSPVTGVVTCVRPREPATREPLPKGWISMGSKRWPGKTVYVSSVVPNMHIAWRPFAVDARLAEEQPERVDEAIKALRRALVRVGGDDPELKQYIENPEELLRAHKLKTKAKVKAASKVGVAFSQRPGTPSTPHSP